MQPRVVSETHDGTLTGEMRESIWFFGLLVCEVQVRKRNGDIIWRRATSRDSHSCYVIKSMWDSIPPPPSK